MVRDSCELCYQTLVIPNTRANQSQFLNLQSVEEEDAAPGGATDLKGAHSEEASNRHKDVELGGKLSGTKRLKKKKKRQKLRPMKELSKMKSGEIQVRGMDLDAIRAVQKVKTKARIDARKKNVESKERGEGEEEDGLDPKEDQVRVAENEGLAVDGDSKNDEIGNADEV